MSESTATHFTNLCLPLLISHFSTFLIIFLHSLTILILHQQFHLALSSLIKSNHVPVLLNIMSNSSKPGLVNKIQIRTCPVASCSDTSQHIPPGTAGTATTATNSHSLGCNINQTFYHHPNVLTSIPLIWQHRSQHLPAKHQLSHQLPT